MNYKHAAPRAWGYKAPVAMRQRRRGQMGLWWPAVILVSLVALLWLQL